MISILAAIILSQADYSRYPEECRPPNIEPEFASDCAKRLNQKKLNAKYLEAKAISDAEEDATVKACGDDYLTLRMGMTWKRAKKCGGPYSQVGVDTNGRLYRFGELTIRVSGGKITGVVKNR